MVDKTSSSEHGLGVLDLPKSPKSRPCPIPRRCLEREADRKKLAKKWPDASIEVQSSLQDLQPGQRTWDFTDQMKTVKAYVDKMNDPFCSTEVKAFEPDFFDNSTELSDKHKKIWDSRMYDRIWIPCYDLEPLKSGGLCNLWIW